MNYVTYEMLFVFCGIILAVIGLVVEIMRKK